MELIYRRPDGTFVAIVNELPYHVTVEDPLFEPAQVAAAELGDALPFEPVPEPLPLTLTDYQRAIEAHVDATAQAKGYKSDVSCASHVASTVAAWRAEAEAFVAWRDAVWQATFAALAAWQGGAPAPTIEGLIADLPAIEWPS